MNKKTWTIVAIVLLVAVVGVAVLLMMQSANNQTSTTPSQNTDTNSQTPAETQAQPPNEAQTGTAAVEIQNFAFSPSTVTVKKGTVVKWTNKDSVQHTVTADTGVSGGPDSKLLAKDESYEFSFDQTGTFTYHCKPHPNMKGTVTVVD